MDDAHPGQSARLGWAEARDGMLCGQAAGWAMVVVGMNDYVSHWNGFHLRKFPRTTLAENPNTQTVTALQLTMPNHEYEDR